ncbi:MAG: long-chain fatty acid--CoA ligase, partial [Nocardioides sp.]|nr:long-chain fatty acid--CoA ligase [Nocardioides sp.]
MSSLSLAAVLAEPARRTPHKTALVQGDLRLDYATIWRRARQVAAALADRGIGAGDRVALLAPNVAEFVFAYYGIQAIGAVVVPIPTLLNAQEATYLLRHSGSRLLLRHAAFAAIGDDAAAETGIDSVAVEGLGEGLEPSSTYSVRSAEDLAVIFYTSGTTGRPKGAMLTHLNMVMNATVAAFDGNGITADEAVMACLPLFHAYGQSSAMNGTFRVGGTLVLQPRFDAAAAIELMARERVTLFMGVPTMYVQLLQAVTTAEHLPKLHHAVSGGASLPVAVLEEFEKVFGCPIFEGYGLSETSPTATVNQSVFGAKAGSVGHPIWGVQVEVADASIEDRIELLPPGERGEIVISGHNVFAGYLDDPEATRRALVDGWFRSGDIGTKDDDGRITIVDRKKDLIIRSGFNVYPREVEEVLARHPSVGQVAVIGVPDDEHGEEVCAVVVPAEGATVDTAELIAYAREQLARHKYPRLVHVVDDLPLGPSHKVLKRELRARFR